MSETDDRTEPAAESVPTPSGDFIGTRHNGVLSLLGITYATARRFEQPTLVEPGPGPVTALAHGPICPQIPTALDRLLASDGQEMDERCLTLDVHTPGADDAARPVVVWIHGGAFVTGAGSLAWYHGANLARFGDVVVVSINYRLGAFGFSGTADLGLADQLCALGWVQRHIASLGGDPARVTVFGESAGGASVIALMATPASAGLFAGAWAMSPSLPQLRSATRAERALVELLDAAGCADLEGLCALDTESLLTAQGRLLDRGPSALTAFSPTIGGDHIPSIDVAVHDRRPLVVGTARDEMHLFAAFDAQYASLGADVLLDRARAHFPDPESAVATYRSHRPGATAGQLLSAIQTDQTFRVPATRLAEARSGAGSSTWMYWFTMPTPVFGGVLGSCHGLDIPYVFRNLEQPGAEMFTGTGADRHAVADALSAGLVHFAHRGRADWSAYHPDDRSVRLYGPSDSGEVPPATAPTTVDDPERDLRLLWADTRWP